MGSPPGAKNGTVTGTPTGIQSGSDNTQALYIRQKSLPVPPPGYRQGSGPEDASTMDKIIKFTVTIFLIVLVGFIALAGYDGYAESAYRNTLTGTYSYTCTITTDSPLTNVTLFLPVPADRTGNSPMVTRFSDRTMAGVPGTWNTALFDTGKATLLKIAIPSLTLPEGAGPAHPLTVTMTSDTPDKIAIDSRNPIENSVMYRPVQNLGKTDCPASIAGGNDPATCYTYQTSVYADYRSSPDAIVTITSTLTGRNTWKIFEPRSNEYHAEIALVLKGEHHGWAVANGSLTTGLGDYSTPS
jgi:hypothetical protein